MNRISIALALCLLPAITTSGMAAETQERKPTKEFEIKKDRPYLGGQKIDIWGLRCGNALYSQAVTERHVRNLDNMVAHGINCIGVYIQGSNGGHPDPAAGRNGYEPNGKLKPEFSNASNGLSASPISGGWS